MKRTLQIEIDCGEKTCASEKGKFCQSIHHGPCGVALCDLFGGRLDNTKDDYSGWTLRCDACLAAEVKK